MVERVRTLSVMTLAVLSLSACASPQGAVFYRPTASEIGAQLDNYGEAVIPADGLVVVQGDDLVYGDAIRGGRPGINGSSVRRTRASITETLRRVMTGVRFDNRGYPGDTAAKGAARWADLPAGNLLVLSYGFGDARVATPPDVYAAALRTMIERAHAAGAAVFVIPTPPVADPKLNASLAPYQAAARAGALETGAEVFEPSAEFARVKTTAARGVAQTPAIYEAIAGGLVSYIRPVAASPQTGQAGSGDTRTVRASADRAS